LRNAIITSLFVSVLAAAAVFGVCDRSASAQGEPAEALRVGEKLTYNISFNRLPNVAYAETNVVSKGKIAGKEAYEVRSRFKTLNFLSAGSLPVDIDRTTYISPADGSSIVVKNLDNSTGAAIATSTNFIEKSPGSFDLTAMLFRIRSSGGVGSFSMFENEKLYTVTLQSMGTETVKSDAGDFPASIVDVKSDFLTESGYTGLQVSISSEGANVPVKFRLKRGKNQEYIGLIASIQVAAEPTPTPTPAMVQTPRPTPVPTPKPPNYIPNQPLTGLPFDLGESLEYSVTTDQREIGTVVLAARERRLVNDRDSLILTATVTGASSAELFGVGNSIRASVDPETLAPYDISIGFSGTLAAFNQTAQFDPETSRVSLPGNQRIDVPVGTHNVLSLIYALRLFNLNPSKDATNRVNDTRVSVFWQGRANIFTLRPSVPQIITIGGQKILAQQVAVSTGNPQLDALQIKVWLSNDDRRLPLRFALGRYQLELKLSQTTDQP
jgi:hypothetical protein